MEIKEWWDIEYTVKDIKDRIYSKEIILKIKNHSPFNRTFRILTEEINISDQLSNLKFRMYYNLTSPKDIVVEKYRKEEIEILIPKIINKGKDDNIVISVENLEKKEKKTVKIYV